MEIQNNSSNTVSQIALKVGIGVTWRIKIAKLFSSSIQDCTHGGSLETLQTTSDFKLLKAI